LLDEYRMQNAEYRIENLGILPNSGYRVLTSDILLLRAGVAYAY